MTLDCCFKSFFTSLWLIIAKVFRLLTDLFTESCDVTAEPSKSTDPTCAVAHLRARPSLKNRNTTNLHKSTFTFAVKRHRGEFSTDAFILKARRDQIKARNGTEHVTAQRSNRVVSRMTSLIHPTNLVMVSLSPRSWSPRTDARVWSHDLRQLALAAADGSCCHGDPRLSTSTRQRG